MLLEVEVNILLWIASLIFGKQPNWVPILITSRKSHKRSTR